VLRRVAKFAVAVAVTAPTFSKSIDDAEVARWAKAGGVGFLVPAAWTEGEAAERGVSVSDGDVEVAMAQRHDGLTTQDLRYEARIGLLNAALRAPIQQAAARSVTPAQIDAYVRQYPASVPERRRIRIIDASSERRAEQIRRAIARGLTWKAAARRFRAPDGVRVITADPVALDDALYDAVNDARKGQLTRFRSAVFAVLAIQPERPLPPDQQKAHAWEVLAGEAQQRATTEYEAAIRAKWRPRTSCNDPATARDFCSNSPTG
jgi:DNA-binding transcriptional MerR regulator